MIQNENNFNKEGTDSTAGSQRRAISRAKRRALANITPENSHPQKQSLLFTALPSEIRNLIFMYAVCQEHSPFVTDQDSHRGRPGHRYDASIDTALLRTCRLIYYETRSILPGSTTHHMWEAPSESFNPHDWDHYLFHLPTQTGRDLYHLHVTKWKSPFTFSRYLRDHLHWKKLTWTLRASEWTYHSMHNSQHFDIRRTLQSTVFPSTCHEINIEFESLINFPFQRMILRDSADKCKAIPLTRQDGTALEIDAQKSVEYTWHGRTFKPPNPGTDRFWGSYVDAIYHAIRLCWRDKVPEREYMRYDRLDCLHDEEMRFMTRDEIEEDVEAARQMHAELID